MGGETGALAAGRKNGPAGRRKVSGSGLGARGSEKKNVRVLKEKNALPVAN